MPARRVKLTDDALTDGRKRPPVQPGNKGHAAEAFALPLNAAAAYYQY
jgi:hypothetical protein